MTTSIILAFAIIIFIAGFLYRHRVRREALKTKSSTNLPKPASIENSKASVLHSRNGPYTLVKNWPRPRISSKELLIRNRAIGLNPVDWKCVTYGFGIHAIPWISGREAAGTVEEVGSEVHGFQRGDRVWVTSTSYRDNRTSTFQQVRNFNWRHVADETIVADDVRLQYTAALPFNVGRLPDWISFEEGATLGVGSVAAFGALYDSLAIPWPFGKLSCMNDQTESQAGSDQPWILIWGASSVIGMMAIQLAKQRNLRIFAVAGSHNVSELLDLGADQVYDRHRPEEAVTEAEKLGINLGIDCIGQETATFAIRALQTGGKLACLVKAPDQAVVEKTGVEVVDVLIKRFHEDAAYGGNVVDFISHSLFTRVIRPVRYEVVKGGLEAVETGLQRSRDQGVSGRKLVIRLEEDEE